jgi:hypothetical protein
MRKSAPSAIVALGLCLLCPSSRPQASISELSHSSREASDRDDIVKRQQWFKRGRQQVHGRSAAALRLDAYRQMVARRKSVMDYVKRGWRSNYLELPFKHA